jgi:hypothetical protein
MSDLVTEFVPWFFWVLAAWKFLVTWGVRVLLLGLKDKESMGDGQLWDGLIVMQQQKVYFRPPSE